MRKIYTKVVALLLLLSLAVTATGCTQFFENRCIDNIITVSEEFIESVAVDGRVAFKEYSYASVKLPKLNDKQLDEAYIYLDNFLENVFVGDIDLAKDRKSATVEIIMLDAFVEKKDVDYVGDEDEIHKLVKKSRKDVTVDVEMIRDHNQWIFEDLNPLVEEVLGQYMSLNYLNEDGLPSTMTQTYVDSLINDVYVDCLWYDPIMGDPLTDPALRNAEYLMCVFYFSKPQTITFMAHLYYNDQEIMSREVSVKDGVTLTCDFGYDPDPKQFESGTYKVVITVDKFTFAQSPEINVI